MAEQETAKVEEVVEVKETVQQEELPLEVTQSETEMARLIGQLQEKVRTLEEAKSTQVEQVESQLTEEELLREIDQSSYTGKGVPKDFDIEKLSNAELAGLIMAEVERHFFSPVVHRLEMARVKEELKEARGKYSDFDRYKPQVHKVASANPSLSIEDAYLIVKTKAGGFKATEGEKREVRTVSELAKEEKKVVGGERPRGAQATVDKAEPTTIAEAVRMAADKVFKD